MKQKRREPVEFSVSHEQREMMRSIAEMVRREIVPVLDRHPKSQALPKSELHRIFGLFAEQLLLAPRLPADEGGPGIDLVDYGMIFEQIPPVISMSMLSQDACIARLYADCSPEQRERFLPGLVSGEAIGCTGSTEPDTGSDPRGIKTRARRDGDTVVINGHKMWITNVSVCDLILVTCLDESAPKDGPPKVIKVVVEREHSPFEAKEIDAIGLKQGFLGEAVFEECRVPASNIVEADSGTKILNESWSLNRVLVALQAVYMAQHAFDQALEYAGIRHQFGKPIAAHQLVQKNLSDIQTAITTSRLLCYQTLWMMDQKQDTSGAAAMTKRYAQNACQDAVWQAMNILGAMGLSEEAGIEQLYRDIRMLAIPDGTNEILALIHGRFLTNLEAFRGVNPKSR